jgi:hypothetical protein
VEGEGHRWRALAPQSGDRDGLTRQDPGRIGVEFTNSLSEQGQAENRILGQGSGLAFGDVDGDDRADLFVAAIEGESRLYRNRGGWRFEDVTGESGVDLGGLAATSAAIVDVDGDGDEDIVVGTLDGTTKLFDNDGTGRFTERGKSAGLSEIRGTSSLALADIDGDSDLDLYVASNKLRAADDVFHPMSRGFDSILVQRGDTVSVNPRHGEYYRVRVEPDGRMTRLEFGEPDDFYLNDGSGSFERVPFTGGSFLDEEGRPLAREPDEWGLTVRFQDLDGDLDPDIYVCNDFESPDHIWMNQGDGRFRAASLASFRTTSWASMSVDFSDVDRDGRVDLLVADMLPDTHAGSKTMIQLGDADPLPPGVTDFRMQQSRNTLFLAAGEGLYSEIANYAGVDASNWTWGIVFLDVDLDGYEDLLTVNGHAWDVQNADLKVEIASQMIRDWERLILEYPVLAQHNVALRNRGDTTFEAVSSAWGWGEEADVSHGISTGDVDGDGDLDVAVSRLNAPTLVYRNDAQAPRIAVRLRGAGRNTHGVGSRITVRGGPVAEQTKEVTAGGLYLSSAEPLYTFATGDASSLTIEVAWRSGRTSVLQNAVPGRLYELVEPVSEPVTPPRGAADRPEPLFEDVTEVLAHAHVEEAYDDFARQPLLFGRLSQLGPGLTWHDWDRDGDPDLLVPSGAGGGLDLLTNEAGQTFVGRRLAGAAVDQTAALVFPGPRPSVLVGQSNYEAPSPDSALAIPGLVALQEGVRRPLLEPSTSTTGPVSLADIDGDGDLDAFVGGRVVPAVYPRPASSRILLNREGTLEFAPDRSRPFENLGMVSGSVFTDVDADGDPDLVLALDWGSLRLFENESGVFSDVTEAWGLAPYSNRWNGVTAGDLDGDGRMDLVATGWGRNTAYEREPYSAEHPLRMYWGDFDGNGRIDVVEAAFDPAMGAYAPRERLEKLGEALPFVRRRTAPRFEDYAVASVETVLGSSFERAVVAEAATLDHMVFLNRDGGFEGVSLPGVAQFAPAFHAGVADVDGDGAEDVFLSQNYFPTERFTGRYDAGRGLLLLGDGAGALQALSPGASGLNLLGEQRGAAFADYDLDGRVDLVVSQNGTRTRLFRNSGGTPGLRVRLEGLPGNPDGIGAQLRVVYREAMGPAREIHAGAGYWSQDDPVAILGLRGDPQAVWVRWPGGEESTHPVPAGATEVRIPHP